MSETQNEIQTVQQYRHAARRQLKQGREALSLRTDETREVYELLNGMIEQTIAGQVGLSQDQQVERLDTALTRLKENQASLPERVAAAREAILAQVDGWENSITEQANGAVATLTEARDFARERDFDAWQAAKAERRGTPYVGAQSSDAYDETEADDEDDDL